MINSHRAARPPIYLIDDESERLANLALSVEERLPEVSALLLGEIDRAKILPASRIPADVVTMNAEVEFIDEGSMAHRRVTLVYPKDADATKGHISILTLAGAGLIGLKAGKSIRWPDREGQSRNIRILAVRQQAEANANP